MLSYLHLGYIVDRSRLVESYLFHNDGNTRRAMEPKQILTRSTEVIAGFSSWE